MGGSCVVPNCRSNYRNGPKKKVYGFPKDPILRKRWILAIKRDSFTPTVHSKVCELHFKKTDFITTASGVHDKTGVLIVVGLKNRRLQPTAIPSIFPNPPVYSVKNTSSSASPNSEKTATKQEFTAQEVQDKGGDVCELHFEPSQIIREASGFDPRTGRTLTAPLAIPRLQKGAVPVLFIPPPGPLAKPGVDPVKLTNRRKNQPKETEETVESELEKLLQTATGTESQSVAGPSIAIKQELAECTAQSPQFFIHNVLYMEDLEPSSSTSSLSSGLTPSDSLTPSSSTPLFINSSSFLENALLGANPDSTNVDETPVTESQNVTEPSIAFKQEPVESTDESTPLVVDDILSVEELVPSTSSSSLSSSSPLFIKLSSFPQNALPVANPDSTNVGHTPLTNKPERKRKMNDVKPDASDSISSATKPKLDRLAKPSTSSKRSSEPHPPSGTKKSAGRSISPTEDTQNATREIFQSLMHGSENNPFSGSRTRERPGDLFDVFSDFIAEKLREMNWDNCAFALRSILEIVFKAGQVQQSSGEEDSEISNPGSSSSSSSDSDQE